MWWRRKPPQPDPWNIEVRKAQHELRRIEAELATFDHRSDMDRLRKLTGRHLAWCEFLRSHGIHAPDPIIRW